MPGPLLLLLLLLMSLSWEQHVQPQLEGLPALLLCLASSQASFVMMVPSVALNNRENPTNLPVTVHNAMSRT